MSTNELVTIYIKVCETLSKLLNIILEAVVTAFVLLSVFCSIVESTKTYPPTQYWILWFHFGYLVDINIVKKGVQLIITFSKSLKVV